MVGAVVFAWLNLKINSERLQADFEALAEIGVTMGGGVSRLALSNEDLEARSWFADRIEEAGLLIRDDEVGNLSGVLCSDDPEAKTLDARLPFGYRAQRRALRWRNWRINRPRVPAAHQGIRHQTEIPPGSD